MDIIFYTTIIAIMVIWTAYTAAFTMLWVTRQISIETDAVQVVPDKASDFYVFNWQTWTMNELIGYIIRHYWTYFAPTVISFASVIALLFVLGAW